MKLKKNTENGIIILLFQYFDVIFVPTFTFNSLPNKKKQAINNAA